LGGRTDLNKTQNPDSIIEKNGRVGCRKILTALYDKGHYE
jgi:hypothetical protein